MRNWDKQGFKEREGSAGTDATLPLPCPRLEAGCSEEDRREAERVRKTRLESCKKWLQRFT